MPLPNSIHYDTTNVGSLYLIQEDLLAFDAVESFEH